MKKARYLFFFVFLVFSFYLTDKVMVYIDNKSPLMQEIIRIEDEYNVKPVNAIIKDNTIIPGIKGKEIDKHKSLLKMEEFGYFNDTYLVYNLIDPDISLSKNKDKIIIKGNSQKRNLALVLEENELLENYLSELGIKYNILTYLNTNLSLEREYINGEDDEKNFSDLDTLLKKYSLNKNICFLNYSNLNYCRKKEYFIVSNSLNTKDNINNLLNKLDSGDIVLIYKTTSLEILKLILSETKKIDLNIVYLSELISE